MRARYPAVYADAHGEQITEILNDGNQLRVTIRGVEFVGAAFDTLETTTDESATRALGFTVAHGELCGCELRWKMPIPISNAGVREDAMLSVRLVLGVPAASGLLDCEDLELRLEYSGRALDSKGTSGSFEDELLDLQRKLPPGVHMQACINCAWSDYSPAGGALACFRGNKAGYRAVTGKAELFQIWDSLTEFVQETYLCPEFELRVPGTGYRG